MVSAAQASIAPSIMLLSSFSLLPCPSGPMWNSFSSDPLSTRSTSLILARASSEPPSAKAQLPTPDGLPMTGASTKSMPLGASASPIRMFTPGSTVLMLTTTVPSGAPDAIPPSPSTTFSVSAGPGTNIRMTRALPASSAGEPHTATPASEARLTAGGYGSYPATGTPLSINFFAQLLPITPSPTMPTVSISNPCLSPKKGMTSAPLTERAGKR